MPTSLFRLRCVLVWIALTCCTPLAHAASADLPSGSSPDAIRFEHFPDRLHCFVWRSWHTVEPARMARVLGTTIENVTALAESMGLPPAIAIPPEQKTRGYITVLRRNWHLLPYDQLLVLLDMTADQLAYSLREDDFLWIKLGRLKPKCEPLVYRPPDEKARRHAARIKAVVQQDFGEEIRQPGEPRFEFINRLGRPRAADTQNAARPKGLFSPRFIYSYFALYGDPLVDSRLDAFPEGLFQRLADVGVDGVWVHVVLRNLAPGGETFPEFGAKHGVRLANLRKLVGRAQRHGVSIYLYMNEPRAMPTAFFQGREEMAGVREGDHTTICTSHPAVRRWMSDSLAYVFEKVPGLGGVFTITASENLTNCASHGRWRDCPRCKDRSDAEIIAEVNATIASGVHRGNPGAKVIAWDWGWRGHGDATEIIQRLPKSVWLMSVSEWSLPIERGGVKTHVGEYSMSAVGPGPRATRHWALAKQAGLKTVAKVQLNCTWELSAVPYLPVMDLVAEHCYNLATAGVDGMMLSWTLGGYPSPNLEIAQRFGVQPTPSIDGVLDAVARERFGPEGARMARRAWTAMSEAFREYPYNGGVVYRCPAQFGPANLLYPRKTGYAATMVGFPYDDLNGWRGPYPADAFIGQFEKVAAGWNNGLNQLRRAVRRAPADRQDGVQSELRFAEAAGLHFSSVANQARFVHCRDALADKTRPLSETERTSYHDQIRQSVLDEIAIARRLYTLTKLDSRIGFEASNQYYYVPLDLVEKVINCRYVLDRFGVAP